MGPQQQTCCLLLWVSGQEITLDCCIASTQQQQQYVEGCATFSAYMKLNTDTHTHTFNGPFSGTTRVSRYQKGKTNLDFTEARFSGSGISWAICKSAPRSRQIAMPAPHRSVFYRPDALPATQPTASKR